MVEVKDVKGKVAGLRIGAIVLWVLAIGFEVLTIYLFNNTTNMTYVYIALAADAVACIVGALLWKRANRFAPCKSKNKAVKFIWDQMGVIACLVAFIPLGILLLRNEKLDPKVKRNIAIVAGVLFLGAMGGSIDYDPVEPGDVQNQQALLEHQVGGSVDVVYWTEFGKSYHVDPDCPHIRNRDNVSSGTLEEAFAAKKQDPCDTCVGDIYSANDTTEDDEPVEEVDDKTTDETSADEATDDAPAETEEAEEAEAA